MSRNSATTITVTDAPSWLPFAFQKRKEAIRFKFRISDAERRVYRKRKPVPVSKWAELYRVMTYGPLTGGKWDNSFMPHLKGIMDASFFPSVEVIGNCKAPQTGGSVVMETCLAYAADMRPGPALVVYPSKNTAANRSTDYFQDVFKKSPRLQKLLTGFQDDMAGLRIKLLTMLIYMGWAGSETSMGNVSVKYLVLDEVDKYPDTPSKKEAGTMDLAKKRVTAFKYGKKIWITSTPTMESGNIWQYLKKEAQEVFDYWVRCPGCNEFLLMKFDDIDFCGERDPIKMETEKIARYSCRHCGDMWDDYLRDQAVQRGEWRARKDERHRELMRYLREERPKKICFHSPSWISHLISLSDVAASHMRGDKDKTKLKDFMNQHKAEPWINYLVERREEDIYELKDDRPRGVVPGGGVIQTLLAAADTQDDGFWYEIRAFGWGPSLTSWGVQEGKVPTFEALAEVLFGTTYQDTSGKEYPVVKAAIDTGGHRTKEVYDFCRKYRGKLLPIKGASRKMDGPHAWTPIEYYPGSKKPLAKGLLLYRINTALYKGSLAGRLEIALGDPGAWHLHSKVSNGWCKQMTVEFIDESGAWVCPSGKANHAWDVSVYLLFLADFFGLHRFRKPASEKKPVTKKPKVARSKYING